MTLPFFVQTPILTLQSRRQIKLIHINEWLSANRLSLNLAKTHFIHFTLNKNTKDTIININLNSQPIKRTTQTKILGIIIQSNLKWNNHIQTLSTKLAKINGILFRLSKTLPNSTLKLIYNTLFLPTLSYCISIWGNNNYSFIDRLKTNRHFESFNIIIKNKIENSLSIQQKKSIRIINHASFLAHTLPLFKYSKTLKLNEIYELHIAKLLFKALNYSQFECLSFILPPTRTLNLNLRKSKIGNQKLHNLFIPRVRLSLAKNDITYTGPIIWNSLPTSIKNNKTFTSFTKDLTFHLLTRY